MGALGQELGTGTNSPRQLEFAEHIQDLLEYHTRALQQTPTAAFYCRSSPEHPAKPTLPESLNFFKLIFSVNLKLSLNF